MELVLAVGVGGLGLELGREVGGEGELREGQVWMAMRVCGHSVYQTQRRMHIFYFGFEWLDDLSWDLELECEVCCFEMSIW